LLLVIPYYSFFQAATVFFQVLSWPSDSTRFVKLYNVVSERFPVSFEERPLVSLIVLGPVNLKFWLILHRTSWSRIGHVEISVQVCKASQTFFWRLVMQYFLFSSTVSDRSNVWIYSKSAIWFSTSYQGHTHVSYSK